MTLRVQIHALLNSGAHEAHVVVGNMQYFLKPGDSTEVTIYEGQDVLVSEVEEGTGARVASEALAKAEDERAAQTNADGKARDLEPAGEEKPALPVVSDNETTSTVTMGGDQPEDPAPTGADAPELPADPAPEAQSTDKPAKAKR